MDETLLLTLCNWSLPGAKRAQPICAATGERWNHTCERRTGRSGAVQPIGNLHSCLLRTLLARMLLRVPEFRRCSQTSALLFAAGAPLVGAFALRLGRRLAAPWFLGSAWRG